MRDYEGQGQVHHAPDIVERPPIKPESASSCTIGSLRAAGCAWPRERLQPVAASRSVVDVDRRLLVGAAECLSLGLQTRRARPKSFLRRPPRGRRRPRLSHSAGGIYGAKCDYVLPAALPEPQSSQISRHACAQPAAQSPGDARTCVSSCGTSLARL